MVELAYCRDNDIDRNSLDGSRFILELNPEYSLYWSINESNSRQIYAGFTDEQKDILIRAVNKNPTAHLTRIPAVGNTPAYAPEWAKEKYGRKEEHSKAANAEQRKPKQRKP